MCQAQGLVGERGPPSVGDHGSNEASELIPINRIVPIAVGLLKVIPQVDHRAEEAGVVRILLD